MNYSPNFVDIYSVHVPRFSRESISEIIPVIVLFFCAYLFAVCVKHFFPSNTVVHRNPCSSAYSSSVIRHASFVPICASPLTILCYHYNISRSEERRVGKE